MPAQAYTGEILKKKPSPNTGSTNANIWLLLVPVVAAVQSNDTSTSSLMASRWATFVAAPAVVPLRQTSTDLTL